MTALRHWLRLSTPPRAALVVAVATAALGTLLSLTLTILSVSLLGLSAGNTLTSIFGLLIVVELIAFTRAPSRYFERRAAHRVGYEAVASWRRRAALSLAARRIDRVSAHEAAATARQVTTDTDNLQSLWLTVVIPLSGAWMGLCGAVGTLAIVLGVSGATSALAALWWGLGEVIVSSAVLVGARRGLDWLEERSVALRSSDRHYVEALGTARSVGASLLLLARDGELRHDAIAAGRRREVAADALRRGEWLVAVGLSVMGVLGSAFTATLWGTSISRTYSSLSIVALVGTFVVSLAQLEWVGVTTRALRGAIAVAAITDRLDTLGEEVSSPPRLTGPSPTPPSTLVCVTGPSGAGKSTFLAALCGIADFPIDGSIGGELARRVARAAARGDVTWVPTESFWLDGFARDVAMVNSAQDARASEIFRQLGLPSDLRTSWSSLSRGEQSRAALARALLPDPPILVCDEPTHALDEQSAELVISLLRRHSGTVIVATHDPRLVALADEVWTMPSR